MYALLERGREKGRGKEGRERDERGSERREREKEERGREREERGRERREERENVLPWLTKKETASRVGVYTYQDRGPPDS